MAQVIRTVMPEFGACGPGFALNDPEVDHLSVAYAVPSAAYFVLERDGRVVGGGGIAPLAGGDPEVCELRKMYFLGEVRGHGQGRRMLQHCLETARRLGYRRCYLETLTGMDAAQHLYVGGRIQVALRSARCDGPLRLRPLLRARSLTHARCRPRCHSPAFVS